MLDKTLADSKLSEYGQKEAVLKAKVLEKILQKPVINPMEDKDCKDCKTVVHTGPLNRIWPRPLLSLPEMNITDKSE